MTRIAISLGSNLGDRGGHIAAAISRLRPFLGDLNVSALIETEPVGVPAGQPRFLNGAITADFAGTPRELLRLLRQVEDEGGRMRPFPGAPRTLDLDLILFGDRVVGDPDLHVPHPRFRERAFVLAPLAEIAPDAVDPVSGQTIARLYELWKEQHRCG